MQQFCAAIGRPELAARGLSLKPEDQQALKREIEIEFEKRDFAQWCEVFAGIDACVEPMLPLSEATEHPQIKRVGWSSKYRAKAYRRSRSWPAR